VFCGDSSVELVAVNPTGPIFLAAPATTTNYMRAPFSSLPAQLSSRTLTSAILLFVYCIMPSCLPLSSCSPMSFANISPSYISELCTFEMDSALACPCYQWLLYVNRKSMTKVIWLYQMLFSYESEQCFSTYIVACSWDCKIIPSQGFDFRA
jgi:hypothetical protein